MAEAVVDIDALAGLVTALVRVLERDPGCGWVGVFRRWLADAAAARTGASREDVERLAADLTLAFAGGMGSFSDYIPHVVGQPAPWAGEVEEFSRKVSAAAWAVRRGEAIPAEPAATPDRGGPRRKKGSRSPRGLSG